MRVVAALDSFKGTLSSAAAGAAVVRGFSNPETGWEAVSVPIADGGEGTLAALLASGMGELRELEVPGVAGEILRAQLLWDGPERLAVIETAEILGFAQVDPVGPGTFPRVSTYGLGLAIRAAEEMGAKEILVALGGTACTDGGVGMLLGLGADLVDPSGDPIRWRPGQNPLRYGPAVRALPSVNSRLVALLDVDNPYSGPRGAAAVFGPQKGLTPTQVQEADGLLASFGASLEAATGKEIVDLPGAGAAGGLGGALASVGADLAPGFATISKMVDLDKTLVGADLVVTGEGRIDAQTLGGKAPLGVAQMAAELGIPTVALAGSIDFPSGGELASEASPFSGIFSIQTGPRNLREAMEPCVAATGLEWTARQLRALLSSS